MEMTTRFINANGLRHSVSVAGAEHAPAAVLIHGFPDSKEIWRRVAPALIEAGFRLIMPDMRGFGDTDAPARVADYDILSGAAPDIIGIMDALHVGRAHLVGHDFGAPVGWALAANTPQRFHSFTAMSVGHPRAFLNAGWDQRRRSFYILCHQFRGLAEAAYRANNWALFRKHWRGGDDIDGSIERLARPGRLTAGLNWYRANTPLKRILGLEQTQDFGAEVVRVPTLGLWSDRDPYLGEEQMVRSSAYVDAPWRCECLRNVGHWMQIEAPETVASLLDEHWRSCG